MSKTGILTPDQVTDEFINEHVWGENYTAWLLENTPTERMEMLYESKRKQIVSESHLPQRIINLKHLEDGEEMYKREKKAIGKYLMKGFPAVYNIVKSRCESKGESFKG
jgi:hypothetical protein